MVRRSGDPASLTRAPSRSFRLEQHAFFYFSQILARRTRAINQDLAPFGLDYSRWRVIAVLHDRGVCGMGQLAELTSIDRTTLTRIVGQMESASLLKREVVAQDRRQVSLSLTPRGKTLFQRILPGVLALTDRALAGFTPAEADALREGLRRIADNLSA